MMEVDYRNLVPVILLDCYSADIMVGNGIKIDAAFAILKSFEAVGTSFLDAPLTGTVVASGDIDNQSLFVLRTEGVTMETAAQGRGQFCIDMIAVKIDLIITGMGRLVIMTEP